MQPGLLGCPSFPQEVVTEFVLFVFVLFYVVQAGFKLGAVLLHQPPRELRETTEWIQRVRVPWDPGLSTEHATWRYGGATAARGPQSGRRPGWLEAVP